MLNNVNMVAGPAEIVWLHTNSSKCSIDGGDFICEAGMRQKIVVLLQSKH